MNIERRDFLSLSAAGVAATAISWSMPSAAAAVQETSTETLYLSGKDRDQPVDWEFKVTSGRNSGVWSTIPTPSNWECQGFGTYRYGFNLAPEEKGYYRHSFIPPERWHDKRIYLVFEGAMTDTEVQVNGKSAGPKHQGGFYRFRYDVTDKLVLGKENLLEATVSRESSDESINRAERMGDYWNFSGIYRPVYLQAVPTESIERLAVDARADGSFAVDVHLEGITSADQVIAQIRTLNGVAVGTPFSAKVSPDVARATTLRTTIVDPDLWTAETPNLYRVEVTLLSGGQEIHRTSERFGFRTVEVRPGDGIYINGQKIVFKGVNRHTSWPLSGRTSSTKLSRDDILLLKEMNMNAVRMAHYPPDTHFLDYCDEIGLYVLDELAGWQKAYSEEAATPLVKSMVTRDVNHPSIVMWCNGNEGGWNTAIDDDYALYDPQKRTVLHPWAMFNGVNTDHYENYSNTQRILGGSDIFMPTEFLHGLYDGGHGAGLEDYWKLMGSAPLAAGGFLWALADEGVVRDDRDGAMDVVGNSAPDGIVGPFREKEGSFYTIKDIWSPIQLADAAALEDSFPASFSGEVSITNRYQFANASSCRFTWSLIDFADPTDRRTDHRLRGKGTAESPDIAPGETGSVHLRLPASWQRRDALTLTVADATGRDIAHWVWTIKTPADHAAALVSPRGRGSASATVTSSAITMSAGKTEVTIDPATGRLAGAAHCGIPFPLANGPALATGTATLADLDHGQDGSSYVVQANYTGDLERVRWRLHPSGWLQLTYKYNVTGTHDFFGVNFDYPEAKVEGVTWLGHGPYRVWKNRMRGGHTAVWTKDYNDTATGAAEWNYPEFKGYHANLHWAALETSDGPMTVVAEDENMFLRLFTPTNGPDPRFTAPSFPAGDLSFLDAIPAIGTKFAPTEALGPQSQQNIGNGPYEHTLHFRFGK